jgi:dihydrofolate synthase/folylpolyglutamate synthase
LGPTLADIAREKAGILKPSCPAVIGILPPEAQAVVASRLETLNCLSIWVQPAQKIRKGWARYIFNPEISLNPKSIDYPLPLLGEVPLLNSAIAITTLCVLQQQGWKIPQTAIEQGMAKTCWLGRLQWLTWQNSLILIDGAHNPSAA